MVYSQVNGAGHRTLHGRRCLTHLAWMLDADRVFTLTGTRCAQGHRRAPAGARRTPLGSQPTDHPGLSRQTRAATRAIAPTTAEADVDGRPSTRGESGGPAGWLIHPFVQLPEGSFGIA